MLKFRMFTLHLKDKNYTFQNLVKLLLHFVQYIHVFAGLALTNQIYAKTHSDICFVYMTVGK